MSNKNETSNEIPIVEPVTGVNPKHPKKKYYTNIPASVYINVSTEKAKGETIGMNGILPEGTKYHHKGFLKTNRLTIVNGDEKKTYYENIWWHDTIIDMSGMPVNDMILKLAKTASTDFTATVPVESFVMKNRGTGRAGKRANNAVNMKQNFDKLTPAEQEQMRAFFADGK